MYYKIFNYIVLKFCEFQFSCTKVLNENYTTTYFTFIFFQPGHSWHTPQRLEEVRAEQANSENERRHQQPSQVLLFNLPHHKSQDNDTARLLRQRRREPKANYRFFFILNHFLMFWYVFFLQEKVWFRLYWSFWGALSILKTMLPKRTRFLLRKLLPPSTDCV